MAGESFEQIATVVKDRDQNIYWEIVGIYRAEKRDIPVMKVWQPELCVQEILQSVASLRVI